MFGALNGIAMNGLFAVADYDIALRWATSAAIGLLIGAERERRKGEETGRSPAGIRTFAIASLAGGLSITLGGGAILAVTFLGMAALCTAGYLRTHDEDVGFTTEAALLVTVLLGGFALREPAIAAALAVSVSILLIVRERLHHFVRAVLTEDEIKDALLLAAIVVVIFPLVPDRYVGPFGAINLRIIWKIVILVTSISGAGYIAVRVVGPRYGLPLAGMASGFVSSAATIGSMGARARQDSLLSTPAVAGAVLATTASLLELALMVAATSRATLAALAPPLLAAAGVATVYGGAFTVQTIKHKAPESIFLGRAFSLKTALLFASIMAVVLLAAAASSAKWGTAGAVMAAAVAGLADTHAAAVSIASLVASGKIGPEQAVLPILAALTTNTITKIVLAVGSGGRQFAARVIPGLVLVVLAAWLAVIPMLTR